MSSEWLPVSELLSSGDLLLVQDGNHGGNYPKVDEFVATGIPLITGACLDQGTVDYAQASYLTEERAALLRVGRALPGDVLLTHKGTMGKTAIVPKSPHPYTVLNPQITLYRVAPSGRLDRRFLKYYFDSAYFQELLARISSTSTISTLSIREQKQLIIPVPDLATQKGVVGVLGVLDDRITLLRETNATLEAVAQTLFKSWFVDFDPVRAKMAGRAPEGMDEATASLFPDALEESELGVVPKGWQFGTVGDIARLKKGTVNPGSQPDVIFEHFSLPAFDNGRRPVVEPGEAIKSNKTPVSSDAVLLSKLNPHIPRVWLPVSCGSNAVCSTEFLVFQPVGAGTKELIYCTFSSPDFILRLQQLVTGTSNSHQRIKPDQVELMSCVVPPKDIASQFELSMRPIFERVHANREQAQTLASLRDALLPRLVSGQLRWSEALESALDFKRGINE